MNVVFIVSDTLRRDHLGCYGNEWIRTPCIDRLAAESVVFDGHYAASFPTMPGRADYYTGRWTFTYMRWQPLPADAVILPELLQKAGYTTLGVADTPFFDRRGYNYDRGFREFIRVPGQAVDERARRASLRRYEEDCCACASMMEACRLLEHYRKEPFFLYIDTWDPHEPWNPPAWYVERYLPGYDGRLIAPCYARWQEQGFTEEDMEVARASYAGEVSMVDRWVGHLLEKLEAMNLWDSTAVVLTTDHGFYFGEHGGLFGKLLGTGGTYGAVEKAAQVTQHWFRSPLYEEIVHIPLMLKVPGVSAARTGALTSAVDLMPTVLELAGVDAPDTVQGMSLLPATRQAGWRGREVTFSSLPLHNLDEATKVVDGFLRGVREYQPISITTEKWNLQYAAAGEPVELYDLQGDPAQSQNVAEANPDVVGRLHGEFLGLLDQCPVAEHHRKVRASL